MITRVDRVLIEEAERFAFRFRCEACAHFDPGTAECANAYPAEAHRDAALRPGETLLFCKQFELA